MVKSQIAALFAILFVFSACTAAPDGYQIASEQPAKSVFSEAATASSATEAETFPIPQKEKLQITKLAEVLPNGEKSRGNLPDTYKLDSSNIEIIQDGTARFMLTITNTLTASRRDFVMEVKYSGDFLGERQEVFSNFSMGWGNVYLLTDNLLTLAAPEEIIFLNADTLTDTGLVIRAEQMGGEENYFAGITYHSRLGYVVPASHNGADCVVYFEQDGTLREISEIVRAGKAGTRPIWNPQYERQVSERSLHFPPRLEVIDLDVPVLFWPESYQHDPHEAYFYNINNHVLWDMKQYNVISDGNTETILYTADLWGSSLLPRDVANAVALEFSEGKLRDCLFFDCRDLPIDPGLPSNTEITYHDGVYQIRQYLPQDDNSNNLDLKNELFYMLTLDFKNHNWEWKYDIKEEYLQSKSPADAAAVSKDGRYLITPALSGGGGDGWFGYWVILDTQNDNLRYLCRCGTLPFAGQDVVFLNNNTIGVVFNDAVILYKADTAEKLDFSLEIPFGSVLEDEKYYNEAISFCANDDLTRFAVLYLKKDVNVHWTSEEYNHHAALFDSDGKLLCDVETEIPMFRSKYTIYHPKMELDINNMLTVTNPMDEEEAFNVTLSPR